MGVSWKGLFFVLTAVSCFLLLSGCAQKSAADINYLGLTYEQSPRIIMPDEYLLNTGVSVDGLQLYVPVKHGEAPPKAPEWVFAKDSDGKCCQYRLSTTGDYAYVLYGTYNANETVVFGLANTSGSIPVEIQRNDNGTWTNVNSSALKMTVEGGHPEWTWDQRLQDGSIARPGKYRALIGQNYTATFSISADVPYVGTSDINFDNATVEMLPATVGASEYHAFDHPFRMTPSLRDDTVSTMQYKALMMGQSPEKLGAACDISERYLAENFPNSMKNTIYLPSLAMHVTYEGRPSWLIFYDWEIKYVYNGDGTVYENKIDECTLGHFMAFVVDDANGEVVYYGSCA